MQTNYFVCTLGQAAAFNDPQKPYRTICEFLSYQAENHPDLPAVGFPVPPQRSGPWDRQVLSFYYLDLGTTAVAGRLVASCAQSLQTPQTVALLCNSTLEFLFAWLGLMRLGHSVLLIAPQCQPSAIVHLCKTCNVSLLFHDQAHSDQAHESVSFAQGEGHDALHAEKVPFNRNEYIGDLIDAIPKHYVQSPEPLESAIAYLHHTSGTSSGLPKPIPHSHRAAIGVLPHLPEEPSKATFTTTPLYHGGIADLFRAWTSNAMIWLFPGGDVPITARNICNCLVVAEQSSGKGYTPAVKYFSSVPYVLQMMEADQQGLEYLKGFDIVGVGGAALPGEVGDRLVKEGVNLISRFGSAECGFLLSSYRDFASDKEWQYLHNENPTNLLMFEPQEDGLAELVIKQGWPHMAKRNRKDKSFATADLFGAHPTIKNAWAYHSRADSQLTLITGKKFDPAPLEAAIATVPELDDVLIFGDHRAFPGALLFRSKQSKELSDKELLQTLKSTVQKLNDDGQAHTQLSFNMLIPMPYSSEGLEKSSKGTILRKAAEFRFRNAMEEAYDRQDASEKASVSDKDMSSYLNELVQSTLGRSSPLDENTDLFSVGMDSVACMQLRGRLRQLIPQNQNDLPLSIVEDCGNIRQLSEYLIQRRYGNYSANDEDEHQLMLDLVKQYGSFDKAERAVPLSTDANQKETGSGETVVLTGATGALGAHILDLLRRSQGVATIYCLARGPDENPAKERVSKALEQRGLEGLAADLEYNRKIRVLQAQLGEGNLGLTDSIYEQLACEVTLLIHVAWTVNFRLSLRSFVKDNVGGVRNLIDLALKSPKGQPPRFVYCSSTAAVMNAGAPPSKGIPETIIEDPATPSPLGYSQSKWVAEQICSKANSETSLRGRVSVMRVGQLSGDSESGIWNTKEAWPIMLSSMKLVRSLPDLGDEPLDWLPVDVAAKAFLEAAQDPGDGQNEMRVYHILNDHQTPRWSDLLKWLKQREDFNILPPNEWVKNLEQHQDSDHPALKLLGMWREAYGNGTQGDKSRPHFDMSKTRKRVPALKDVQEVSEEYLEKIWRWVQDNVH